MEKVVRSKGDRLNWVSLKDVKPMVLIESGVVGRKVSKVTLEKRRKEVNPNLNSGYLVP